MQRCNIWLRQLIHVEQMTARLIGLLLNIVNWILFFVISHSSVAIPSILDETGRKSSFQYSLRTTDEEQFVKELFWFLIFHHNVVSLIFVFFKIE
jgi:hypothetical protein